MATPEVKVRLSAEGQQEVIAAFRQLQRESASAGTKSAQAFKIAGQGASQFKTILATIGTSAIVTALTRAVSGTLEWADALDEAAGSLGVTTDFLQEVRYAAVRAGTPIDVLNQALSVLQQKIQAAADAGEPLQRFTDGTEIAAKDASGAVRGVEAVLVDLVAAFARVDGATTRSGLAADLFGSKIGRHLVNLLNLGGAAFAGFRAEAHATGDVLSEEMIKKGGRVNDELELLQTRLTVAFASGLLDFETTSIETLHAAFTDPALVANVKAVGGALGDLISWAANNFEVVSMLAGIVAGGSVGLLSGNPLIALGGAALGGGLGYGVGSLASGDIAARSAAARAEAEAARAAERSKSGRVVTGFNAPGAGGQLTPVDAAAEAKREAERKKVAADSQRAAERATREAEKAAQIRQRAYDASLQYEAQLLEQQGKRHEAALAALAIELATYEENLRARGDLDEGEIAKRVEVARTSGEARAEFEELQRQSQAAFDDLASQRAQIEEQVSRGIISEQEGAAKIAALDKDRLANLQAIADAMLKIAEATGDPEQIAAAKQLAASIGQVRVEADRAGQEAAKMRAAFAAAAENEVASFFESILDGSKSVDDAFKDLVKGIEKEFLSLISKQLSKALFNSLLGDGTSGGALQGILGLFGFGGSGAGYADGGFVRGPGSGTSDSIPARLSAGEYVVRASAVAKDGMREHLEWINRGLNAPPIQLLPRPMPRAYAEGGFVTPAAGAGGTGGSSTLVLQVDESTMRMTLGEYITRTLASERWRNK